MNEYACLAYMMHKALNVFKIGLNLLCHIEGFKIELLSCSGCEKFENVYSLIRRCSYIPVKCLLTQYVDVKISLGIKTAVRSLLIS